MSLSAKECIAALDEWIDVLDSTPREGAEKDEPEGSRYIQISDTLAQQLVETLKAVKKIGESSL